MKKAAHQHGNSVVQLKSRSVDNNYAIKYVASPAKSYLVNPTEGPIDYSDSKRNFNKFFDRVANQPIVKHRISKDMSRKNENKNEKWYKTPNEVKSKLTTRPRMRGVKGGTTKEKEAAVAIAE